MKQERIFKFDVLGRTLSTYDLERVCKSEYGSGIPDPCSFLRSDELVVFTHHMLADILLQSRTYRFFRVVDRYRMAAIADLQVVTPTNFFGSAGNLDDATELVLNFRDRGAPQLPPLVLANLGRALVSICSLLSLRPDFSRSFSFHLAAAQNLTISHSNPPPHCASLSTICDRFWVPYQTLSKCCSNPSHCI